MGEQKPTAEPELLNPQSTDCFPNKATGRNKVNSLDYLQLPIERQDRRNYVANSGEHPRWHLCVDNCNECRVGCQSAGSHCLGSRG